MPVGLGVGGLVAMGSSVFANSEVCWTADTVGIEGGAGRALLFLAGLAIALLVDFLLPVCLLTRTRLAPDFSDCLSAAARLSDSGLFGPTTAKGRGLCW
ncbi:hypothetical protein ACF1GT_14780 [Streptomyces sp. NPDC014636]|uniref:hypothetical protein n=1 Tax=Streptomyces sp. NPDC014636 TaxID=3364876 RepID=UPI0036F9CDC2